ncbi:unnamed protein product [Lactuca virosa]|uniref:Uncharacterized protein n=1 Tax=Lactuca virosa TaxID=75947 RepID=A0AAU9N0G0_9ASTR|nr:unnamed protein product [Lactuca virosa]
MIIEDEGRTICTYDTYETIPETLPIEIGGDKYMDRRAEIHSNETFHNLRMNLVEHLYGIQNIDLNLDPPEDNEDEFSKEDFTYLRVGIKSLSKLQHIAGPKERKMMLIAKWTLLNFGAVGNLR